MWIAIRRRGRRSDMPIPPEFRAMITDVGTQALKSAMHSMFFAPPADPPAPDAPAPTPASESALHSDGCPYCAANDHVAAAIIHLIRAGEVTDLEIRDTHNRLATAKLRRAVGALSVTEVILSADGTAALDALATAAEDESGSSVDRARRAAAICRRLHELAERRNLPAESKVEEATRGD
jgi:hypothetical protein